MWVSQVIVLLFKSGSKHFAQSYFYSQPSIFGNYSSVLSKESSALAVFLFLYTSATNAILAFRNSRCARYQEWAANLLAICKGKS